MIILPCLDSALHRACIRMHPHAYACIRMQMKQSTGLSCTALWAAPELLNPNGSYTTLVDVVRRHARMRMLTNER